MMDLIFKAVVRLVDFDLLHSALDVALGHLVELNIQSPSSERQEAGPPPQPPTMTRGACGT